MKQENIFSKIFNRIRCMLNKQKLITAEESIDVQHGTEIAHLVKFNLLELEELQYELENGYITEDELD